MTKRTGLALVFTLFALAILPTAAPEAARAGGNGKGGGGSTSSRLQTTIIDSCALAGTDCDLLSDDPGAGYSIYTDESLAGGDAGILLEFGSGDYKGTFRSSSLRRAWVNIDSAGCSASFLGRLRFLRIDGIETLGSGASRETTAYAQIDGPDGLIWNLFWNGGSIQVDRDLDGIWNAYSKTAASVEIQRPGGRKKWETCDTSATVDFDVLINLP